uniref:BZIP domain-containing protein n=2 Tax=Davidia involucrata TaxID=16924 RepID=A0A5B6YLQ1_DAVIN
MQMLQPLYEMENEQNMDAPGTGDSFLMKPLDDSEHAKSHNDIMARRMKNRERQRRYRARKRLEADMKKASITNQSIPLQVNGIINNCTTRIYCQRDWKKDARRAHTIKEREVTSNGPVIPDLISASECQAPPLLSGVSAETPLESEFCSITSPMLDNSGKDRIASGRRHWKAEARSKKN